jgi:8-oxo-dGTP pyrophosphatase MutT (NUDIX family)
VTLEPAESRRGFLVCVVFVIERAGHVLLLRRSRAKDHAPGEWETGSGGILSGEAPGVAPPCGVAGERGGAGAALLTAGLRAAGAAASAGGSGA